jgi:hypothetical protein
MALLIAFAALVLLGMAARAWGADSRNLNIDPRNPRGGTGIF